MELKKRGIFFSTDAIIATVLVLLVILVAYPLLENSRAESEIHYDLLNTLSEIKVSESENSLVNDYIADGTITNLDNSLLEQIGELYVTDEDSARQLAQSLLVDVDTDRNLGIWFGNVRLAEKNLTSFEEATDVDVARQLISGIKEGENVTGFSARAYLSNVLQKKYFYFGGYVGDGNISLKVNYNGNISAAELELAIEDDFDLYINDNFAGHFSKSPSEFVPAKYDVLTDYFQSGDNLIEIKGNKIHVAGGFLKIIYEADVQYEPMYQKSFQGVEGLINIYDGLYVPGNLTSLNILLHVNSSQSPFFFSFGNSILYNGTTDGEEAIFFNNSELVGFLNYEELSETTVPVRVGLENVSFFTHGKTDSFSVTDISGSMLPVCLGIDTTPERICCLTTGCTVSSNCASCGGTWEDKISTAKEANRVFINSLLNFSENRIGVVAYNNSAPNNSYHPLSYDNNSLIAKVNQWSAKGTTCICCGINKALNDLINATRSDVFESIVVMSDGLANVQCAEQGTGSPTQDAIQAACNAYAQHDITVYAIGFGDEADEATLQSIASCGNGEYYYADVNDLVDVYADIAESIIAEYNEQSIEASGNIYSRIYPDSYIEFDYIKNNSAYGLILTTETSFNDSYSGSFDVPSDSAVLEMSVASYSGSRWTDFVRVNGNVVYNLSSYGNDYKILGDPYLVNVPTHLIFNNQSNIVEVTTGTSPFNSTQGSSSNKIISTISRDFSSFSPIVASAQGCNWRIQFEDYSEINTRVPVDYIGSQNCEYSAGNMGLIANDNDALQLAVRDLLRKLDFDSDGLVDVFFTAQQLQIRTDEIIGIPFTWATEVQIRIWR